MQRTRYRSPRFRPRTWDPDANYGQVYGRSRRTFPRFILRLAAVAVVLVAGAGAILGAPQLALPAMPTFEDGAEAPNLRIIQSPSSQVRGDAAIATTAPAVEGPAGDGAAGDAPAPATDTAAPTSAAQPVATPTTAPPVTDGVAAAAEGEPPVTLDNAPTPTPE